MKTIIFILVFALICGSAITQTLKNLDEKYGFREAKFEMSLSSFKNLEKFDNEYNGYTLLTENLKIGEYILEDISYYFYNEKLYDISITVKSGYTNTRGILEILENAYGKGKKEIVDGVYENYKWKGEKVEMTYKIYDEKYKNLEGELDIYCLKLEKLCIEEMQLKEKQELSKAIKEL